MGPLRADLQATPFNLTGSCQAPPHASVVRVGSSSTTVTSRKVHDKPIRLLNQLPSSARVTFSVYGAAARIVGMPGIGPSQEFAPGSSML